MTEEPVQTNGGRPNSKNKLLAMKHTTAEQDVGVESNVPATNRPNTAIVIVLGCLLVTMGVLIGWNLMNRPSAAEQYQLGVKYRFGRGVARSEVESVKWFQLAAEQGHAHAQYWLGMSYAFGKGVAKDPAEAIKWLEQSADNGDEVAQYELGRIYRDGELVNKDYVQAYKWLDIASILSEKLEEEGVSIRTICSELKKQMPQDQLNNAEKVINEWHVKAAERGIAAGQFALGIRYSNGAGVPKDNIQAHKWISLALAQCPSAKQEAEVVINGRRIGASELPSAPLARRLWISLQIVENKMTSEQIAEARKLSKKFPPRK